MFWVVPILTSIVKHLIARYPSLLTVSLHLSYPIKFLLGWVLVELGSECRPDLTELRNAGKDAACYLYTILLLAARQGTSRATCLSLDELMSLEI